MTDKQSYETSEITRQRIMDTAEAMFLEQGIDAVSDRAILRESGQRNLSALKYHFGGRDGLITALHERRALQIEQQRQKTMRQWAADGKKPRTRDVCEILISIPVALCQKDESFRLFLARFGHYGIFSNESLLTLEPVTASIETLFEAIVNDLPDMDENLLLMRIENANALGILALTRRAESRLSFKGKHAALFVENLLDQLEAMLKAPVSDRTLSVLQK